MPRSKRKTAKELVTTVPNWFERRNAIVLALCQGPTFQSGKAIVDYANQIIEALYND